jgi:adenosylcobinamide-phosphate synthase
VSGTALLGGYAADLALGDPRRWHPVAGFGRAALALERAVYSPSRTRGVLYATALVGVAALAGELLARAGQRLGLRGSGLVAVTWAALGGHTLVREAERVADHLERGDLDAARAALPALVGRDVDGLDEAQICRAVVESVAENTSDAVVGALFWAAVGGPAGVAAYRAANTLDAMVGRRDERYESFGWASARLDDLMSLPAARGGAALAAACAPLVGGSPNTTWEMVRRDGPAHPSPNAGRMEAAFAGALGLRLGGPLAYAGHVEERATLGEGRLPQAGDVRRAVKLSLAVGAGAAVACALVRGLVR